MYRPSLFVIVVLFATISSEESVEGSCEGESCSNIEDLLQTVASKDDLKRVLDTIPEEDLLKYVDEGLKGGSDLLREAASFMGKEQMSNTLVSLLRGFNAKGDEKKGFPSLAGLSTFLNGGKIKNKDAEESTKANNAIDALIGDSDLLKEAATLLGKGQMSNTLISLLGGLNGSKDKDKKGALASLAGLSSLLNGGKGGKKRNEEEKPSADFRGFMESLNLGEKGDVFGNLLKVAEKVLPKKKKTN